MILATSISLCTFLLLYTYSSKKLLNKSWVQAQRIEGGKSNIFPELNKTGNLDLGWLFSGPGCTRIQELTLRAIHLPKIIYRLAGLFLWSIPKLAITIGVRPLFKKEFAWKPKIKDQQLYDVFCNSALMVACSVCGDGKRICFQAPEDLPLTTRAGIKPAGLKLRFDAEQRSIEEAVWQGRDIRSDKGLLATLIINLICHWGHTQSHILSELSAREIAQKGIKDLEPSNRYVVALHDGLMYGKISPITERKHFLSSMSQRDSIINSCQVRLKHDIDENKLQFRYFNFLFQSRLVMKRLLNKYELEVNAEFLFNNMIVHSLDHYLLHKYTGKTSRLVYGRQQYLQFIFQGQDLLGYMDARL